MTETERLYPTPKEGIYGKTEKPERVTTRFGEGQKDKDPTDTIRRAFGVCQSTTR